MIRAKPRARAWAAAVAAVAAFVKTVAAQPATDPGPSSIPSASPSSSPSSPSSSPSSSRDKLAAEKYAKMSLDELLSVDLVGTTATKTAVVEEEVPSVTTIIPRASLIAYGFRTVPEALASVTGVYVFDDGVTSNVGMRGVMGGPESWSRVIKVLVDGVPITDYSTGGTLLGPETIPIEAVDRIEIVRGPASALYGANAFLGVVNIVTRDPQAGSMLWAGGEIDAVNGNLGYAGHALASYASDDKKAGFLVAASTERTDRSGLTAPSSSPDYNSYAGEHSVGDISRPATVFAKAFVDKGELGSFQARYIYEHLDSNADWSTVSVLKPDNRIVRENSVFALDHRLTFTNELSLRTFGAYSASRILPEETLDADDVLFLIHRDHSNHAWTAGSELTWAPGKASVLAGIDFIRDTDSGDTTYQITDAGQGVGDRLLRDVGKQFIYNNVAGYAQALVPLNLVSSALDQISVLAGARVDLNDFDGTTLSTRAGLVYHPTKPVYLKLLYGDSYVPPSPSELFAAPIRAEGGIVGNPNLKPQSGRTVEALASYKYLTRATFQASVYGTWVSDLVEFIQQSSQNEATNLTDIFCYGIEAQGSVRLTPFFITVDASAQRVALDTPRYEQYWYQLSYGSGVKGGSELPNYPALITHANAGVTLHDYHVEGTISLGVYGERKSSIANIRAAGESYLLPAYQNLGFNVHSLGLHLIGERETTISLHGTNVIGTSYANGGALGVDIPALGRSLFLKISQEL